MPEGWGLIHVKSWVSTRNIRDFTWTWPLFTPVVRAPLMARWDVFHPPRMNCIVCKFKLWQKHTEPKLMSYGLWSIPVCVLKRSNYKFWRAGIVSGDERVIGAVGRVLGEPSGSLIGTPWPAAPATPGNLSEIQSLWATPELMSTFGDPANSVCAENMYFSGWETGDAVRL